MAELTSGRFGTCSPAVRGVQLHQAKARAPVGRLNVSVVTTDRIRCMTTVAWPGRRGDVINSLFILMTLTTRSVESWPDLTAAVHWLVDDTFWDLYPP
jgi:hypothetical protein